MKVRRRLSSPSSKIMNDKTTSTSNRRHIVASIAELSPGKRKVVAINGREIGVFNVNGSLYALRNICPHRSGPLCSGRLRPLVLGDDPHHLEHERESEILKCPWHQWEFDITTGRALYDEKLRVKTYPVTQEGDDVIIYV